MSKIYRKQDVLDYHVQGRPGEINMVSAKPVHSQTALDFAAHSRLNSTLLLNRAVAKFNRQLSIALLAYPNFGSDQRLVLQKIKKTMNNSLLKHNFPFSRLADSDINNPIFFNLESGNTAYEIAKEPRVRKVLSLVLLRLNHQVVWCVPAGSVLRNNEHC